MQEVDIAQIRSYLLELQQDIIQQLSSEDGHEFIVDEWTREEGGGGITKILREGKILEQAGVNFSHVWGNELPKTATAHRVNLEGCRFQALGVSVVIHPHNPYVPSAHANVRFFLAEKKNAPPQWWFGGGFDLTPYYLFEEDCKFWHEMAYKACEPFGINVYSKYKKWCDDYFYIKHRKESRGIGGLFFDDLNEWPFETCFSFLKSVGNHFMKAYRPILSARKNVSYGEKEKKFQLYRRGRYVEFNLVYDRGTLFGLQSGGRTESILMSLPPKVEWEYNWQPEANSKEAQLAHFLKPIDWLKI